MLPLFPNSRHYSAQSGRPFSARSRQRSAKAMLCAPRRGPTQSHSSIYSALEYLLGGGWIGLRTRE
jgi:hypothetical protein